MKTLDIRKTDLIRKNGRFDTEEAAFPLMWSGSGAEMLLDGSHLEVQIDCHYTSMAPYLSFTVDGVRSQNFVPLKGKHWYPVFLGLSDAPHHVRIVKETQPFGGDSEAYVTLLNIRTNGTLLPLPEPKMKIEFIGDSITSGEGCKGPISFMEWVPMVFSASDTYAKMTADALHAQYQQVSQSGWGVLGGWDNDPNGCIPKVYHQVCGPISTQGAKKEYDFSFQLDKIVIALGTNDAGAMNSPPFTDSATGIVYKLTDAPEDCKRFEEGCLAFIRMLHEKNPGAKLVWIVFYDAGPIYNGVKAAVEKAKEEGIPIKFAVPLTLDGMKKQDMGSRAHPGLKAHQKISKTLVKLLKE